MSMMRSVAIGALLTAAALALPRPAAAHCDSMDGPVVKAAQQALAEGRVERVLVWVRAQDEAEIRDAFARTLEVRRSGPAAQALADRWFFETLVRVHRAGEGEPYTGLKPAGSTAAGLAAADRALTSGSVDALASEMSDHLAEALRARFTGVRALEGYDVADVATGRRRVHAYVEYIHLVEQVHALLHGSGDTHAPAPAHGH